MEKCPSKGKAKIREGIKPEDGEREDSRVTLRLLTGMARPGVAPSSRGTRLSPCSVGIRAWLGSRTERSMESCQC